VAAFLRGEPRALADLRAQFDEHEEDSRLVVRGS
jgi:hypothetical protein